ncbi:FAD-binding protein [Adlercreutzia sp. ZJ138]|uniref:FAD-binding protein n=1 Tax=Adlercreutzia sp. ZJ138 TaxID=2709405 RepID=UPI0013EAE425|nr:FAD-binding protein [Adlercreutzia sp. ZJ138]
MKSNHESSGISRRTFLGSALTLSATAGLLGANAATAFAADGEAGAEEAAAAEDTRRALVSDPQYSFEYIPDPIDESLITNTIDCDVVVVGAGVSGMAGIMYAADQGLNVQVVEKGPHHGVKRMCIAGINASQAAEDGCPVIDPKQFSREFFMYAGGFQSKLPLVSRYAKDSGKWVDWVREKIKPYGYTFVTPGNARFDDGGIWPRYDTAYYFQGPDGNSYFTGDAPDWMELFYEIASDDGAQFHFNEPAVRLEREGDMEGACTSVITENLVTGEYTRYRASKGILLCAGDFFNDKELLHKYARYLERCTYSICEPNNTGDMCKAAMWIGAAMDDVSAGDIFVFASTEYKYHEARPAPGDTEFSPLHSSTARAGHWCPAVACWPVLWVDDSGQRFTDESIRNFQMCGGPTILTTPTGKVWSIWDSAWESKFPEGWQDTPGLKFLSAGSLSTPAQVEKEVELGIIKKFDTIEELAAGCGFDPEIAKATIERYNHLAEMGEDLDCFKDASWLFAIDTPPYYAAQWGASITSTRCGLKTDEHSRVYDTNGKIIPNLYAAGNQGGNFYGPSYPGTFGGTGIGHGGFYSWTAIRDMLGEDIIYRWDEDARNLIGQ